MADPVGVFRIPRRPSEAGWYVAVSVPLGVLTLVGLFWPVIDASLYAARCGAGLSCPPSAPASWPWYALAVAASLVAAGLLFFFRLRLRVPPGWPPPPATWDARHPLPAPPGVPAPPPGWRFWRRTFLGR